MLLENTSNLMAGAWAQPIPTCETELRLRGRLVSRFFPLPVYPKVHHPHSLGVLRTQTASLMWARVWVCTQYKLQVYPKSDCMDLIL